MKKNVSIITLIFLFCLSFVTIGFAAYKKTFNIGGNLTMKPSGDFRISSVSLVESEFSNVKTPYLVPTIEDNNVSFSVTATGKATSFSVGYIFEITNDTFYDRSMTSFSFTAVISGDDGVAETTSSITYADTGALYNPGDVVKSGEVARLKVVLHFKTQESGQTINIGGDVSSVVDDTGELLASLVGSGPFTGNLKNKNIECYNVTVANTYGYQRNINFVSNKSSIKVVNHDGGSLELYTIDANATDTYEVCVMEAADAVFLTDNVSANIYLSSGTVSGVDCGEINFAVDPSTEVTDTVPPEITNFTATLKSVASDGSSATVNLSWELTDSTGVPQTDVKKYYVYLCSSSSNCSLVSTDGYNITSATVNLTTEGNYFFKVYGVDELNHSGNDTCSSDNKYCRFTSTVNYKWRYTVTFSLSNLKSKSQENAYKLNQYTTTIEKSSSNSNYSLPSSITVKVGNNTLSSSSDAYSYDQSTGKIIINADQITDNITITASGTQTCLVEGTKILLANGKVKNIEDVKYDDLLAVYDHDNGGITFEYPIWIEKATKTDTYLEITFSDNTILNVAGSHGLFSLDNYKYISTGSDDFRIGTNVVKVGMDGVIKKVSVKSVRYVHKDVNYYQVSSVRYHNVIANGLLTSDGMIYASNMFKYDNNLTWTKDRNEFLKKGYLFNWMDWKEYFPEYIFEGFRMPEATTLMLRGELDVLDYSKTLTTQVLEPLKNKNNKYLWMVTTSDDNLYKKGDYLYESDSYYVLKKPKNIANFIGWLNTSDNNIYKPGEKVRVIYGMHFIALYK